MIRVQITHQWLTRRCRKTNTKLKQGSLSTSRTQQPIYPVESMVAEWSIKLFSTSQRIRRCVRFYVCYRVCINKSAMCIPQGWEKLERVSKQGLITQSVQRLDDLLISVTELSIANDVFKHLLNLTATNEDCSEKNLVKLPWNYPLYLLENALSSQSIYTTYDIMDSVVMAWHLSSAPWILSFWRMTFQWNE